MKQDGDIHWFWAHRRNASLHHFSFLMHGLKGRGWMPVVDFWFDNQIVVGVPQKGCYVFYDHNQLTSSAKYADVQRSVDQDPEFVTHFRRRTDEIFGAIFFKCNNIDLENLALLSDEEILKIYKDFIETMMVAPIITVQLWGIEACFDEHYKIIQFLQKRLGELGKNRDFEMYKGLLSVNVGETVAYTEQRNFYQVAVKLADNSAIKTLFASQDLDGIEIGLEAYPFENGLIEKHIAKYEWVNTEYVSGGWSKKQWIELFKRAVDAEVSPQVRLDELTSNFTNLNKEREKIIDELQPPEDVLHAMHALSEFIAQRDWTKGYFTRALLSYNTLLDDIARRLNVTRTDLLSYSYIELEEALKNKKAIDAGEIQDRQQNGFVLLIKEGNFELVTGKEKIEAVIAEEGINEPFEKYVHITEFKGMPASRGTITARARVMENASEIDQLVEGEILVTYMTTIEFIPAFRKAGAVITDEGGMSCHAAIISREFKLPCIVGTKIATRVVQTGDMLEVDADKGTVTILERKA